MTSRDNPCARLELPDLEIRIEAGNDVAEPNRLRFDRGGFKVQSVNVPAISRTASRHLRVSARAPMRRETGRRRCPRV